MEVLSWMILGIWLFPIPWAMGGISASFVDKKEKSICFQWITGFMIMWSLFYVISVPNILMEKEFWANEQKIAVVEMFLITALLFAVVGFVLWIRQWKQNMKKRNFSVLSPASDTNKTDTNKTATICWCIFIFLLIFQLVASIFMTYKDGDDAFYVAVSSLAENSNSMYQKLPYTGGGTGLDARHGLAPFPIWIAFLAKISGIPSVVVAHIAVSFTMILLTYVIYYEIAKKICSKKKEHVPLFLLFISFLVLFGDYSISSPENFLIARSRQGKAALGNAIIPMIFLLLLLIMRQIQENQKVNKMYWILLAATVTAGCLCSTLGAFMLCLLIAIAGICMAVVYKKWKIVIPLAICCFPAVVTALIYLKI